MYIHFISDLCDVAVMSHVTEIGHVLALAGWLVGWLAANSNHFGKVL
jgi:hypothetical protein